MNSTKRAFRAWLPPTPCFPEMRESLIRIAEKQGKSLAQVQREAFALFLQTDDTNSITSATSHIAQP